MPDERSAVVDPPQRKSLLEEQMRGLTRHLLFACSIELFGSSKSYPDHRHDAQEVRGNF